jgi:predicted DNA-binding protein (UPF0251 family)
LSAETAASAMGVSRRYLNKLFERDGSSVVRCLLRQRLAGAKRCGKVAGCSVFDVFVEFA